jgi:ECF sigma factor
MATPPHGVTGLLQAWGGGDAAALDQLVPIVYEELRRQAQRYLRRESPGHTLQTTAPHLIGLGPLEVASEAAPCVLEGPMHADVGLVLGQVHVPPRQRNRLGRPESGV